MSRLAANALESMPKRSGKKEPASAAASRPELDGGNVNAAKSGQGRLSRPEIFTIRAASQRLNNFLTVENRAAAGGLATTKTSTGDWSRSIRAYSLRTVACTLSRSVPTLGPAPTTASGPLTAAPG